MRANQSYPPLGPRAGRDVFPLSFAQERLWFLWQLEPASPAYARPLLLRLEGPLDTTILERSLNEVRRRHEILRAVYQPVEGEVRQTVRPWEPWPLPMRALAGPGEIQRLMHAAAREPFDLTNGPVMRASLFRQSEAEHFLLLVFHHIAFDAWSGKIMAGELAQLYSGTAPTPLSLQYADYAAWRRDGLTHRDSQAGLAYWREQLAGELPVLEWPIARKRVGARSYAGDSIETQLPDDLVTALKRLARQERTTLFMVLLAAFKTLVWRYTREPDVIIGCPIAGRRQVEAEPMIGCFINMLALRSQVRGDATFLEFLRQVHAESLGAFHHQDVPFEKVIETVNPPRAENRTPIFQTVMNFRNLPEMAANGSGLKFVPCHCPDGLAQFDLTLDLTETDGRIQSRWIYDCDIFEKDSLTRLAGHFQTLLESLGAEPHLTLAKLRLLPTAERRQLLVEWNPLPTEYPKDKCVHELFEAQVTRTPSARAVVFDGLSWTYTELNERANRLANQLRSLGVGPEVLVAVYVERSLEMVAAVLAVMKAGGAYVPLDPAFPRERIKGMLDAARPMVVLTQESLREKLPSHQAAVVCLDGPMSGQPASKPAVTVSSRHLAYVIFTSGSTGQPKGVQIEHRSLVNYLCAAGRATGITESDVWLAVATLSFDISGLEIYLPLITGACVVVANREAMKDGRQLVKLLGDSNATIIQATPTTWRLIMEAGWIGDPKLKVLVGGEACPPELARALSVKSAAAWNMYGPTEATIWSTMGPLETEGNVSIGRPTDNTRIYIVGPDMEPTPMGVPGELLIGGDGLARSYLNDPGLTAEKFIPDPFSDQPGERLYKTGDLARYWPDGRIEWLGRMDQQVKIRGFRVEPGEIEAVLASHPAVQQAAVILRKNHGEPQLAACIVQRANTALAPGELRSHAKDRLPDYMVPVSYTALATMPLTPNGKVDRKALLALQPDRTDSAATFLAPRSATEEILAEIWRRVLKLDQIGVHDNFFDLGGHSLLAMRVVWEVQKHFGQGLPLSTLFSAPTIEQFSAFLENKTSVVETSTAMRGTGAGAPLFHIPGMWGFEFLPEPVARQIGTVRRFYDGLQYAGLDGKQPPLTRVEDMAAHLLSQIRRICPQGPYCLSGYSFGGGMAIEIARQLQALGQEVELVLLWDSYCPAGKYRRRTVADLLRAIQKRLALLKPDRRLPFLRELIGAKLAVRRQRLQQWLKWHFGFLHARITLNGADNANIAVFRAIQAAKQHYRPGTYAGKVILFQVEDQEFTRLFSEPDALNGWSETLLGEVKAVIIPGDHTTAVLEPAVSVFAEKMRDCLK